MEDGFYTKISEMEPMMPTDPAGELDDLAIEVIRKYLVEKSRISSECPNVRHAGSSVVYWKKAI